MAKICMLLTGKPWNEQRHYHRQAPALLGGQHELVYVAGKPNCELAYDFQFRSLPKWIRKLSRLTGTLVLFPTVMRIRPDVLQLVSLDQLPLGLLLKLASRIKVVYDCREDMFHSMRDHKSRFPKPVRVLLARSTRFIEGLAAKHFDGLIASDPAIADMHADMPKQRRVLFYNTPPLSQFPSNYRPLCERKYDVVVMGSMSPRTGVLDVIEAIGILRREKKRSVRLLLLGQPTSDIVTTIRSKITDFGIEDFVEISGLIPHEDVPATLCQAKIGLVPLPDMPKFRNNIACKAFEYMACGMPTICTDLPPQRLFIEEGKTGHFYQPGDVLELASKIECLLDSPNLQTFGNNARSECERYWNCERDQESLRVFYETILRLPLRKDDTVRTPSV